MPMITGTRIAQRAAEIEPYIRHTPLVEAPALAEGTALRLKLENYQVTGAFKARGAVSKLVAMTDVQRQNGVISASTGNHGAAVAYAAKQFGVNAKVYVPKNADPGKVKTIINWGAEVCMYGNDCVETEQHARMMAIAERKTFVSPYNDPDVLMGQGSIAIELLKDCPDLDAVFVSMGGGGLISGIGAALQGLKPEVSIIGISPIQSPALHECINAGKVIDVPCYETWSDATAGGVEPGSITVDIASQVVDRSVLVEESEIKKAMIDLIDSQKMLVEGAAGLALAGFRQVAEEFKGRNVAVVICGGNIGLEKLRKALL